MAGLWNDFTEKLGSLAGKWTAYAALGSFALYLLGYLSLRFQISTYGVATNLDIFDEKYLFAGCRFLVYFAASIPNILIVVLVLMAAGYVPYRLVPASVKDRVKGWATAWCARPDRLSLLGVVLGVALIQFVMRRCFAFGNLLLREQLPDGWLSSVLLSGDGMLSLFFTGLVAGTLLTAVLLLYVRRPGIAVTPASPVLVGTLAFLVAVEFLLLPVNYGVLISTHQLPRVAEISGDEKPAEGRRGWLVWDTKDAVTYFVLDSNGRRMLATVPRKDAKVRIVAYDDIFGVLFGADQARSGPMPGAARP